MERSSGGCGMIERADDGSIGAIAKLGEESSLTNAA